MNKFQLLIKGGSSDASMQVAKRGMESISHYHENPSLGNREVTVRVRCNPADLVRWMGETYEPPFADGSLLFYNEIKEAR